MTELDLHVLSLRYSSWSIRPWLALTAAGAKFSTHTEQLDDVGAELTSTGRALVEESSQRLWHRRRMGSVTGLFPVLYVDGEPIHESLAICEWVADTYPAAGLWPTNTRKRAQARAICCEMLSGFANLRRTMACHVFARVPSAPPDAATEIDIARVFEIWNRALGDSGGPYLFGAFGIPDCMYFPVLTRFRTYGVELPAPLEAYAQRIARHPAVESWSLVAENSPAIPSYDETIRAMGGDPRGARTPLE
jgi:glutathione S-transferase